jgi:hypothetical protein
MKWEGGGEMFEREGDGEDVDEVVEGNDRGGVEHSADLAEGGVLSNGEGEGEGLAPPGGGVPDQGTIGKDGKDDGVEGLPPVGEGEPTDGVP